MEKLDGYLIFTPTPSYRNYLCFLALAPIRDYGAKGKVVETKKMAIQMLRLNRDIAQAHTFSHKEAKNIIEILKDHETDYANKFYMITCNEALNDEANRIKELTKNPKFNLG